MEQAQKRLEALWHGFFFKEYPDQKGVLQMADDLYNLQNWKSDKYDRLFFYMAYVQQMNHMQRRLRIESQMDYVKSLRTGRRKHMFLRLSMKHW